MSKISWNNLKYVDDKSKLSFIDLLLQKNVNSVVHYDIDHIHKNQVNIQYYVSIEKSFEKSRKKIHLNTLFNKNKNKTKERKDVEFSNKIRHQWEWLYL